MDFLDREMQQLVDMTNKLGSFILGGTTPEHPNQKEAPFLAAGILHRKVDDKAKLCTYQINLAGTARSKMSLSVVEKTLTIKVFNDEQKEIFTRTTTVPIDFNEDDITSKYENGILTVEVPYRKNDKPFGTNIEIK